MRARPVLPPAPAPLSLSPLSPPYTPGPTPRPPLPLPPPKVSKLSATRKEAVKQLLGQHDAVLVFLKSHGCLLNAVKPEMLLDFDDFCRWLVVRLYGWPVGWLLNFG